MLQIFAKLLNQGQYCPMFGSHTIAMGIKPIMLKLIFLLRSQRVADISLMETHQLKVNPNKTELLIIHEDASPCHDLVISLGNSQILPSVTACNLGVTKDNQISFASHVANLTCSCGVLFNNIKNICPFLSTEATQGLVQSLVILKLDYSNSLQAV